MKLSLLIKKRREQLDLSQTQLARNLKVSRQYISSIEKGRKSISKNKIDAFAEALSISRDIINASLVEEYAQELL